MKLETLGTCIYETEASRFGAGFRYVRHVFASSFTTVSRDFVLVLAARETVPPRLVFVGLRASPIVLGDISSHAVIRHAKPGCVCST